MTVQEYIQNNFRIEPTVGDIVYEGKSLRAAYTESDTKLTNLVTALSKVGEAVQNAPEVIDPTLAESISNLSEAIVEYNTSFVQLQPYLTARIKDLTTAL